MSDTLSTVILGIIEGITEFLPISSTGHLLIAERGSGERSELFNVAIQAGAILAIVLIYWRRIVDLLTRFDDPANRDYLAKLVVAFLITAVGGFIATRLGWKLPEPARCRSPGTAHRRHRHPHHRALRRQPARLPRRSPGRWRFSSGACQILAAVFPGTSRSAATIFAAMLVGLTSRPAATEFAFLVGIPTMFAATAYELLKVRGHSAGEDWHALVDRLCGLRRRRLHRREVAAALRADAPLHGLRLVPHRTRRGADRCWTG